MKTHYVLFAALVLAGCATPAPEAAPEPGDDVDIGVLWAEQGRTDDALGRAPGGA